MRLFQADDFFHISNINLDRWTFTFSTDFYLEYESKWPDLFFCEDAPNGDIAGFGIAKVEGDKNPLKKDWHGHVSVLTVANEYRRLGYSRRFMDFMEDISENVDDAWFMDLFVRTDNKLAVGLYKKLDYSVYRHILKYYSNINDAYDMRKAFKRDINKETIIPPYKGPIPVSKITTTL
ncbi:hypothetical protein WA158_002954 [Blastocystis sp. Blastoise]